MKKVLILLSFFLVTLNSCKDNDCVTIEISACSESVPDQGVGICAAYFESWFFDASTSTCSKIGYSECSEIGFQTKVECEACKCND